MVFFSLFALFVSSAEFNMSSCDALKQWKRAA